jgi:hypothetical protein
LGVVDPDRARGRRDRGAISNPSYRRCRSRRLRIARYAK